MNPARVLRLVAAMALLLVQACATVPPAPHAAAIDGYLERLQAAGIFQGAVVLGRRGRVLYGRGFGFADAVRREPFTVDTPSDGASITKTFTAAAVMKLAGESRIELDAGVQHYVPEYPHESTRVRHLLAHSAGLPEYDWFDRYIAPPAVRTNVDQVGLLAAQRYAPEFLPGTRFAYDNVAYDTAALLVERVAAEPYAAYLKQHFLEPLGMRASFVRPARLADFPGVRTRGYRRGGEGAEPFDAFEGEGFHGGGNLYVSAMDLHRWASSFVTAPVLDAATLARGLERARLDDGRQASLTMLSWYQSADGSRHYYVGHHNGFYNFVYWDRMGGTTVAFVSNSGLATMGTALSRALIDFVEGKSPQESHFAPTVEPAPDVLAGTWHVEHLGPVTIRLAQRRRYLSIAGGIEYRMFRFGPGLYAVPGLDGWMRFFEEGDRPALLWDSVFLVARGRRG